MPLQPETLPVQPLPIMGVPDEEQVDLNAARRLRDSQTWADDTNDEDQQ